MIVVPARQEMHSPPLFKHGPGFKGATTKRLRAAVPACFPEPMMAGE
jgi:hypothetical protein